MRAAPRHTHYLFLNTCCSRAFCLSDIGASESIMKKKTKQDFQELLKTEHCKIQFVSLRRLQVMEPGLIFLCCRAESSSLDRRIPVEMFRFLMLDLVWRFLYFRNKRKILRLHHANIRHRLVCWCWRSFKTKTYFQQTKSV